jgi:hypothetical protein
MHFNEKISSRLKRVYIGIAMGIAVWLLYASYLVLSNAVGANASLGGVELVLTPITSTQK